MHPHFSEFWAQDLSTWAGQIALDTTSANLNLSPPILDEGHFKTCAK